MEHGELCLVSYDVPSSSHLSSLTLETSNALLSPLGSHLDLQECGISSCKSLVVVLPIELALSFVCAEDAQLHFAQSSDPAQTKAAELCNRYKKLYKSHCCNCSALAGAGGGGPSLPNVLDEGCW